MSFTVVAVEWCIRGFGVENCVLKTAWKICEDGGIILNSIFKKYAGETELD
jgi:hypothetical protein